MALGASATVAKLVVQVEMATGQAVSGAKKVGKGLNKLTGPAVAAGAALIGLGVKAGKSASRLQQSMGAVDSVFGKSSAQVRRWAEDADRSVGLAASEYGELASVIGAQLKNMGVPMDKVAGQTNDLIKMGADLAATYGGSTAEAVEALGSALRGETDPIERYGISIKQATIEAAVGKKRLAGMTESQQKAAKTTALLGLVTKQAGGAVGAFGREADTAAGQQQRATAAWEDASAELGEALLPAMAAGASLLATMAHWLSEHKKLAMAVAVVVGVLATAIIALSAAVKLYNLYTAIAAVVSEAAWLAALGPIGLVIAAIMAVVGVFVVLYKKVAWFRRFVDATWRAIASVARSTWRAVQTVVRVVFDAMRAYIRAYFAVYKAVFKAVVRVASATWSRFKQIASVAIGAVRGFVHSILSTVRSVLDAAENVWRRVWARLPGPVRSAMNAALKPIGAVSGAISTVVGWVQSLISWIGRIHWPSPPKWLSKIPGLGSTFAAGAGSSPAARVAATAGVRGPAPVLSAGGGVTVVVQGALDPVAVATQIRRILGADQRRRGVVVAGRTATDAGAA